MSQPQPDPVEQGFNTAGAVIASGKAVQAVQTPYATAVAIQRPRNLELVQKACIQEAALAGDDFYYRWGVTTKNKKTGGEKEVPIEGPSVGLALAAVRNFGNCVVLQRPLQETISSWVFTSAFVDLETGFTLERQFRMDKNFTVYGKLDTYRKDDIRFQIGQSKSIRNVVLNAIPSGIISRMMDAAKNSARTMIEEKVKKAKGGIPEVVDAMLKSFAQIGVSKELLVDRVGLPVENWDIEILVLLSGDYKALKRGDETRDTLYGKTGEAAPSPDGGNGPTDLESKVAKAAEAATNGKDNPPNASTEAVPASGEAPATVPPQPSGPEAEAPAVDETAEQKKAMIADIEAFITANKLLLPVGIEHKYNRQSMAGNDVDSLIAILDQLKVFASDEQTKGKKKQPAATGKPAAKRPF